MKRVFTILSVTAILNFAFIVSYGRDTTGNLHFDFFGDTIDIAFGSSIPVAFNGPLSKESVNAFYTTANKAGFQPIIDALLTYRAQYKLDDWLYYQLIRKTAQQLSPKAANYERYTLYKWFLLAKSGYDATLGISNDKLLFYVRSDENIYDIPFYMQDGRQYVCLNYHDYAAVYNYSEQIIPADIFVPGAQKAFSYKVTELPDFKPSDYSAKDIEFNFRDKVYHFKVMLNGQVQTIFANYPVVDFESYFNIPLSRETYGSLIPLLKKNIAGMSQKKGIDYLMRFTRYAFSYENDQENFGKEKRLSPEQTLLYKYSDCDDRVALFFYLVKEIYNLPMIALLYPTHVTIAVQFNKPVGKPVIYNGKKYSVCDPTPQQEDLRIGQVSADLRKLSYQVVYAYDPAKK